MKLPDSRLPNGYDKLQFNSTKESNKVQPLGSALKLILILILSLFALTSRATHVVGGGITYTHMEGANYLLTLTLYRDCSPGTFGLPASVDLEVRWGNGTIPPTPTYNLPLIVNDTIDPAIPPCVFDPGICVEEALYQGVVTLPEGPSGFHMYFTICCRNATIINIVDPLTARETFYAYLPDVMVHGDNSSPIFNSLPPVYVCQGDDLNLDFSASDPDGDSLVYYFYTPFDGVNGTGITFGAGVPPDNINISPVTWQPGFGATDPLDAAPGLLPGLTISPTGLINGIPTAPGQYVVGVMVDEYRDGLLMGRISRDFQFNVLNCPPPLEAGIDVPDVCNGLTAVFDNTTVGISSTYWWDFGTGDPADSSLVFEPTFTYGASGIYTVTLIVDKGTECADTATFTFEILDDVVVTVVPTDVLCNGEADGTAAAFPDDGSLTFEWSTTETGFVIDDLAVGSYWVEGTNALGCVDTEFFAIAEPAVLDANFLITPPSCFEGLDGTIEVIGAGGTAPYTYEWTTPATSGSILTDIGAGTYEVEITDANGCSEFFTVTMDEPDELLINVINVTNVTCYQGADGEIEIEILGGTAPYVIDWVELGETTLIVDDLTAGDYTVIVTDDNGCQAILVITVTEPPLYEVELIINQEEACTDANGELEAVITGGAGPFTYDWDPNVSSTNIASGLSAGTYTVTVTDANGCQTDATIYLPDNITGIVGIDDQTPVTCAGGSDGSITVSMTGGTPVFDYNWSCGCPNTNAVTGLSAGDYWLEVVDANGCIDSLYFTIDELPSLEIALVDLGDALCHGDENGFATVQGFGGTPAYAFEWDSDPVQFTAAATGLGAGTYSVTITDANGCENSMSVDISQPTPLLALPEVVSNNLCFGDSTGVITATGGGGIAPYQVFWNDFSVFADSLFGLPAGFYEVTITDANGCQADSIIEVIQYDQVKAEIIGDTAVCPGDFVEFFVLTNDIYGLYDYLWYVDGVYVHEGNSYWHTIDDTTEISIALFSSAGCDPIYDTLVVDAIFIDPSQISLSGTPDTLCLGDAAVLQAEIDDMTYVSSIYWSEAALSGLGPHTVHPNEPTTYTVTMVDVCGAEASAEILINVHMPPNVQILSSGLESCDELEVNFSLDFDAGSYPLVSSDWYVNGESVIGPIADITFYASGDYEVTATLLFANGCEFKYDKIIGVTVWESPDADFYFNPDPAIQLEITEFVDISKGDPEYWEWYMDGALIANEERPTWVFDDVGFYTVTEVVIDENGCSDTAEHTVEVIGDYTVYVPNAFTPDGNGHNNEFRPVMTNISEEGYQLLIFNRWGEVIFRTESMYDSWDGTYLGDVVKDDVYVWKLLVRDEQAQRHEYNGHVTVLR